MATMTFTDNRRWPTAAIKPILGLAISIPLLTGCQTSRETGTLVGGGLGAAAGGAIPMMMGGGPMMVMLGVGIGGTLGAFAGGEIGRMLDEEEKRKLSEALNKVSSSEPPSGKPQADTAVTDKAEFKAGQTTGNVTVLQRQAQPTGGECQFVRVTVYKNGQERQERQWQCRGK